MKNLFLVLGLVFVCSACNNNKLPEFNSLDKLRIIALEIDSPEVNPGATVTVKPWVSDINETVGLTDTVMVCIDPGIAYGASPSCESSSTRIDIRANFALTITGSNATGSGNTFSVTIPNDATMFAGRTEQEKWNGVNYLIQYKLKNSTGTEVMSVRRIVVSDPSKTAKNSNPIISTILADGVSMAVLPIGTIVQLSTDLTAASLESYQTKNSDGSLTTESELVAVTWMITDGTTKRSRTELSGTNEYTGPGSAPTGRKAHFFAVARDNRAGVKVFKLEF